MDDDSTGEEDQTLTDPAQERDPAPAPNHLQPDYDLDDDDNGDDSDEDDENLANDDHEDGDEIPSPQPHRISPPTAGAAPSPDSPPPAAAVTLASPGPTPHAKPLTLALPTPVTRPASGGGREDCWSEGATDTLIDAWGERYLHLSRGNLKHNHWQEVADAVTSRDNYRKPQKTDVQCKNRIDTLKKKYKVEKAKIASGGGASSWVFFPKLDRLIGSGGGPPGGAPKSSPAPHTPAPPQVAAAAAAKLPVTVPTRARSMRQYHVNSDDSSDGLPPEPANGKRRRVEREGGGGRTVGNSMRELTRAIERFGEVYERVERTKLKQVVELEKQRMSLVKDLELQRIQFYMKTQMEINSLQS